MQNDRLATDQKVGGSNPLRRAKNLANMRLFQKGRMTFLLTGRISFQQISQIHYFVFNDSINGRIISSITGTICIMQMQYNVAKCVINRLKSGDLHAEARSVLAV